MASSRYHRQKARRASTSVSSSGCQFSAPAAALAQPGLVERVTILLLLRNTSPQLQ